MEKIFYLIHIVATAVVQVEVDPYTYDDCLELSNQKTAFTYAAILEVVAGIDDQELDPLIATKYVCAELTPEEVKEYNDSDYTDFSSTKG